MRNASLQGSVFADRVRGYAAGACCCELVARPAERDSLHAARVLVPIYRRSQR